MSDEEINQAIAEHCGWEWRHSTSSHIQIDQWGQLVPPGRAPWPGWVEGKSLEASGVWHQTFVPNYCGSLDAMHEAEDVLGDAQVQLYIDHLVTVAGAQTTYSKINLNITNHWSIYHATARQRAEAFLRTLGKWRDE